MFMERMRRTIKPWVEPATIEEKRALYACGKKFITLEQIPTWPEYASKNADNMASFREKIAPKFAYHSEINDKISIFRGDMTTLEIDAVVNAANESLLGGGGIDGCIHDAAGPHLRLHNATLGGCDVGNTKISPGFAMPAKYILSTVGPRGENPQKLQSCYETILDLVVQHELKTVAFCCVSTGIFGYPLDRATTVALDTVRTWMEKDDNYKKVDRLIFIVFLEKEKSMYEAMLPLYFPVEQPENENASASDNVEEEQADKMEESQRPQEEEETHGEQMEESQSDK